MRLLLISFFLINLIAANAQQSFNVQLLDNWTRNDLLTLSDGAVYSDVHGFSFNGKDYAAVMSTEGTHVIAIDENAQLSEISFIPGAYIGPQVVNRDVYEYNGYLYSICDHGYSTLQIIDLHTLPDSAVLIYDSDSLVERAHSIFIDSTSSKMYICGPSTPTTGAEALDIFSLADPENPVFLYSFPYVNYVHDCYVRNDTAWLNCGDDGVMIVDFTNTTSPVIIGTFTNYADEGYNHSGWLSEDGNIYVFTDENAGKALKLCDATDPNDLQIISLFSSGNPNSVAHNPVLKGNYVYVSYYTEGLQIFTIADPDLPVLAGWYDTHDPVVSYMSGAWGIFVFDHNGRVLLSDRQAGLFLFEFNEPPVIDNTFWHGVYPNPAGNTGWFFVNNSRTFNYEIIIYDVSGKKVHSEIQYSGIPQALDFSSFESGIYFYQFSGTDTEITGQGKFIIWR